MKEISMRQYVFDNGPATADEVQKIFGDAVTAQKMREISATNNSKAAQDAISQSLKIK